MKKYFLTALLAGTLLPVYALPNDSDMYKLTEVLMNQNQKAQQQVKSTTPARSHWTNSTNAHKNGIVAIELTIKAKFDEPYAWENTLTKQCVAVKIAPNYLLASLTCKGTTDTATVYHYRGSTEPYEAEKNVPLEYRNIVSIQIEEETITTFKEDKKTKLLLIKLNDKLAEQLQAKPTVNLFVPDDLASVGEVFEQLIVNRNSMLSGRTCATNTFSHVCNDQQCVRVCWKAIDADNGDPIFGLNPKKDNQEFLVGFNDAEPDGANRGQGRNYRVLSQASLQFLKSNVPDVWQRLQKKIVDESFFK